MRVPARAMPCLTRPKLRKCPKCLERTHPRLPLHATPPTRYVCSFRSLLVVVSGDKNTLFFDTNPPLRHISGVVSLHASPPARTSLFSRRCPFLFRVRRRSFTLISCLFFAYAPVDGVTYVAPTGAGWPGFTYTVAAEASQADLVVAQRTSQDATSNNGSVALNFNHALSQILFSAKCANADFTAVVKTIELSGIQNAGTYTFATSATEGTAIEGSWSGVKGAEGYAYLTNGTAAIAKTTSDPIAGTNGALMLMPQMLTGAKLKVVYEVTLGTGETAQTFDVTKENVELTGTWAPGMKYTYDLTLVSDAKQITLDPSVKPWTESTITDQPSL